MTKLLREGFDPKDARFGEGTPFADGPSLPTFVLDPEYRAGMINRMAAGVEQESGPEVAAEARRSMEREAEEDEARWQEYVAGRARDAT